MPNNIFSIVFSTVVFVFAILVPSIASAASCVNLSRTLSQGSSGQDVLALQRALNADERTQVSKTGAGSPGNETTYFGPATRAAVIKYQNLYRSSILTPVGLSFGTGIVGPSTRSFLAKNCPSGSAAITPEQPLKSGVGSTYTKEIKEPTNTLVKPTTADVNSFGNTPSSPNPIFPGITPTVPITNTGVFTPTQVTSPWMGAAQTSGTPFILMTNDQVLLPGSILTLYGTGFTSQTPNTVKIGNYTMTNVGVDQNGLISFVLPKDVPRGRQYVTVTNANGSSNTDVFIVIPTPGVSGPKVFSAFPNRGRVGTTVTVYGTGFSKTWNDIHFPTAIIRGIPSPDGKTLSFTVPSPEADMTAQELTFAPDITSTYYIINDYGISEGLPFTVQFK